MGSCSCLRLWLGFGRPDNFVHGQSGAGNNWAKGHCEFEGERKGGEEEGGR